MCTLVGKVYIVKEWKIIAMMACVKIMVFVDHYYWTIHVNVLAIAIRVDIAKTLQ